MSMRIATIALILTSVASCTATPSPVAPAAVSAARPRDVDTGGGDLAIARQDLIVTAAARFGQRALDEALAAPAYVIAKRFVGMAPPPPPGAGPDWVPPTPTALLMRRPEGWAVATGTGWRSAKAESASALDAVVGDPRLWSEPAFTPPCPDYGASLLLLKVPGKAATVRKSMCTSVAEKAVFAALDA